MSNFEKVDGGFIVNTDDEAFERFKMARQKAVQDRELQEKVDRLEEEIKSIKKVLEKIYSRIP